MKKEINKFKMKHLKELIFVYEQRISMILYKISMILYKMYDMYKRRFKTLYLCGI